MTDNKSLELQNIALSRLLQLEASLRKAVNLQQLGFIICNKTYGLSQYKQAILWRLGAGNKLHIYAVSGVDQINHHAENILFYQLLASHLQTSHAENQQFNRIHLENHIDQHWHKLLPDFALFMPFPTQESKAGLMLFRSQAWAQDEVSLLKRLTDSYGYYWQNQNTHRPLTSWWHFIFNKRWQLSILVLLISLAFLPTKMSVLAKAEIIANQPILIHAPHDGVIKTIHVNSNQIINQHSLLFQLDDSTAKNESYIAEKTLQVTEAELRRARQLAFRDTQQKSNIKLLQARVEQQRAELNYSQTLQQQLSVYAAKDGLILFTEVNDWLGKPVVRGEQIMQLAQPDQVAVSLSLAVNDLIPLQQHDPVKIYLNNKPLQVFNANIKSISYFAEADDQNELYYNITAELDQQQDLPSIGELGMAKLYGPSVPIWYYLLRRPISSIRQWFGI